MDLEAWRMCQAKSALQVSNTQQWLGLFPEAEVWPRESTVALNGFLRKV